MYINPMNPDDGTNGLEYFVYGELSATSVLRFMPERADELRMAGRESINACIDSMELQMMGIKP